MKYVIKISKEYKGGSYILLLGSHSNMALPVFLDNWKESKSIPNRLQKGFKKKKKKNKKKKKKD